MRPVISTIRSPIQLQNSGLQTRLCQMGGPSAPPHHSQIFLDDFHILGVGRAHTQDLRDGAMELLDELRLVYHTVNKS